MAPPDPDDARRVRPGDIIKMSGALLLNHFRAFENEVGTDAYRTGLATLPPELNAEIDALVPAAWLSVDVVDQVYEAVAAAASRDLSELFPLAIQRGLEATYSTFWRALLRMASDRALLSRAPKMFAKSYTHGVLRGRLRRPGHYALSLTHWPGVTQYRLLGTASGMAAVLRMTGREQVHVTFEPTSDGADFDVRWRR